MKIRVYFEPGHRRGTVHLAPNWLERAIGRVGDLFREPPPLDFEIWHIRTLSGFGAWVTLDNREVSHRVYVAIEAELRKQAAGARLKVLMGGRRR
jgi:hypothetical protein